MHRQRIRSTGSTFLLVAALGAVMLPANAAAASDGLFLPYQAIGMPAEPDAIAVGDVTGDGRDDIVVTTGYTYSDPDNFHLFVLAQTAAGGLAAPVSYATRGSYTQRPGSVGIGDVNGSGRPRSFRAPTARGSGSARSTRTRPAPRSPASAGARIR
jgi:hypothetical protein